MMLDGSQRRLDGKENVEQDPEPSYIYCLSELAILRGTNKFV